MVMFCTHLAKPSLGIIPSEEPSPIFCPHLQNHFSSVLLLCPYTCPLICLSHHMIFHLLDMSLEWEEFTETGLYLISIFLIVGECLLYRKEESSRYSWNAIKFNQQNFCLNSVLFQGTVSILKHG